MGKPQASLNQPEQPRASERNFMPEMTVSARDVLGCVVSAVRGLATYYPETGYPSEYPKHPERRRGAAALLDSYMGQAELAVEPSDGEAMGGYAEVADNLAQVLRAQQIEDLILQAKIAREARG